MIHSPHVAYVNLKEGFSRGRFNNEGYNNPFDYQAGMNIDVLIMGASHMDGLEVMPEDIAANILTKISGKKIYNIGMGAHPFTLCAKNLEAALTKYKPRYAIIETARINFADEELKAIINNDVQAHELARKSRGFLRSILRENLYLYLLYSQATLVFQKQVAKSIPVHSDPALLSRVMNKISETAKNFEAKLIIVYHPEVKLERDGSLRIEGDLEAVKIFSEACESNEIFFIDLSERFLAEYERGYKLPKGFFNSSVTSGHLNKEGHRIFAEEIHNLMERGEGGKSRF